MMNLAEYRKRPALLHDYLPWAGLVAPGVVLNKDGAFQRTCRFRGPDLDSATESELVAVTARVNNALKRLGSGWALFVEAARRAAADYPTSRFPEGLSWLIDEERRAAFEEAGSHFESDYFLTLLYLPPPESQARAANLLLESERRHSVDWNDYLAAFVTQTDRLLSLLDGTMPEIAWLNDAETLTYLHSTISTHAHPVQVPQSPFHIDALLADCPLTGGVAPMLGNEHIRSVSVRGFPAKGWPGLLDDVNRLSFSYRWVTRFICMDKPHAESELGKVRRLWFSKRKGVLALLKENIFQQESPLVDNDATNKAADADEALQELGSDAVAFGYITATVVVTDVDPKVADEKRRAIERAIQNKGFVVVSETINAVEAWLSSIPGQVYANVRQPPVSTLNLAHLMPLSAVWAGPERNPHLDGPALMLTRTDGATPFRLSNHIGDVGHALVIGPTGSGKSVLLTTLIQQFRRYSKSRVFVFDNGRSSRATILGLAGDYYDLGAEGSIAFQPLAQIHRDADRAWGAEWIADLFAHEGIEVTPDIKDSVWSALGNLASAPAHERTLTGFNALLQSNPLRQALHPYTLNGPYGRLLDADRDSFSGADIQGFETEELMQTRKAILPVMTNIFHLIEGRLDGAPTLLILDEAWLRLDDPTFAGRLREWLKMLRKKNVSVIFATQSLADIKDSAIASTLIDCCPTRIYLPSPRALEPQLHEIYQRFGLNDRQVQIIASAMPKRHYYYQSPLGCRLFELGLGEVALAFSTASTPEDQREIDETLAASPPAGFAEAWLRRRKLDWAAELIDDFKPQEISP